MCEKFKVSPFLIGAAVAAVMSAWPGAALYAQDDEGDGGSDDYIEEIITTGTAGGAEVRKFDASFAITTMNNEDINRFSPKSTADLLKLVPGAESLWGL